MTSLAAVPRGAELAALIAAAAPAERDAVVDVLLRTPALPRPAARVLRDDEELIDCIPSGLAAVAGALVAARVASDDVFVDVGSGLGTVAVLAHLLTGATAIGVEIQPQLVGAARARVRDLGLTGVTFVERDARLELPTGSVYYVYTPFIGSSMTRLAGRLSDVAARRQIAVCTLGFDLAPSDWLRVVDDDGIFLTIHESIVAGALPRPPGAAATYLHALAVRDHLPL